MSGKEICVPPPPPDLNCSYIEKKFGESIIFVDIGDGNPDPHDLDRDDDGVGCESLSRFDEDKTFLSLEIYYQMV
ncbi:MAG: hypothetical protein F6K18_21395 [Okeania sp. SIO2C2]|uniref:hypothetical protein n=1 Tax=Okeania sp. SIO2C2 TaxID=2607787 RepID=UPI0013B768EA|nr:hypothetical protein [Okeania sp. SIO2C2]NEP89177.1 hypothetical protein [Okeania sp. SIO2C2]